MFTIPYQSCGTRSRKPTFATKLVKEQLRAGRRARHIQKHLLGQLQRKLTREKTVVYRAQTDMSNRGHSMFRTGRRGNSCKKTPREDGQVARPAKVPTGRVDREKLSTSDQLHDRRRRVLPGRVVFSLDTSARSLSSAFSMHRSRWSARDEAPGLPSLPATVIRWRYPESHRALLRPR